MVVKRQILRAASVAGAFALVRDSAWRRKRLMILCYHGISIDDEHLWNPSLYMSAGTFRRRLQMLRSGGYNVLRLDEAVRRLFEGTLPPRGVVLTFDDGAMDFAKRALPLLQEFEMPATVYLTTYYCARRDPVFSTALRYTIWKGRTSGADHADLVEHPTALRSGDAAAQARTSRAIADYATAHHLSADEKTALLRRVAARLGLDFDAIFARGILQIMPPETVRALPRDLVDVEMHTHRHRSPRDAALFARELDENRDIIVALRGGATAPAHFCYPNGDYHRALLPCLEDRDVKSATTCIPGLASPADNPLLLPRFVDADTQSDVAFEAWVSGFGQLLPKRSAYRVDASRL
jgi:peptidoglycan/xylan/chitin deacetylase (PgdA/CDA1 family)